MAVVSESGVMDFRNGSGAENTSMLSPDVLYDATLGMNNSQPRFTMNWDLAEELVGPVIAAFVSIEFVLSLVANIFICVHTLSNRKSLRKSSTILLLNLSLANLLMTVLYMPSVIVASAAEEWIFGQTDQARNVTCQMSAFVFAYTVGLSFHTLAAISFDRFLSIVKPQYHKRWMTPMVTFGIVVFLWIFAIVLNVTPWIGLGEYGWSTPTGSCLPEWFDNADYVVYFSVESIFPFGVIAVTTIWTYGFTKKFIKTDFQQQKESRGITVASEEEKSVYSSRIRNLIGIFGALLICNLLTLLPYITASIVGLIIGFENLSLRFYAAVFILFLFSNITNPVIQSYFRKELRDTILKYWATIKRQFCKVEVDRFVSGNPALPPPTLPPNPQSVATMLEENMVQCPAQTNLELHDIITETVGQDSDSRNTDRDVTHDADATPSNIGTLSSAYTEVIATAGNENDTSITGLTATTHNSDQEIIHKEINIVTKTETSENTSIDIDSELPVIHKEIINDDCACSS